VQNGLSYLLFSVIWPNHRHHSSADLL